MTQPAPVPVENPIEVLLKQIFGKAGITPDEVISLTPTRKFVFSENVWELGMLTPGNPNYRILSMFFGDQADTNSDHTSGDVRVYCIPTSADGGYARYVLNRSEPTVLRADDMFLERFIEEVAYEWEKLADLVLGGDDEEGDEDAVECPSCKSDTSTVVQMPDDAPEDAEPPPPKFCGNCGHPLPAPAIQAQVV